jgi:hypothetical protein
MLFTLNTAATLVFNDTDLADMCGFSNATQASAGSHASDQNCAYTWHPSKNLSDYPLDLTQFWAPRSSTILGRSIDGTSYTVAGSTTYDALLSVVHLPQAEVITPSTGTVGKDLQQFWLDVPAQGQPMRIVMDISSYAAAGDYKTGLWGSDDDEELGSFLDFIGRTITQYQGLWDVEIPLMKKV